MEKRVEYRLSFVSQAWTIPFTVRHLGMSARSCRSQSFKGLVRSETIPSEQDVDEEACSVVARMAVDNHFIS